MKEKPVAAVLLSAAQTGLILDGIFLSLEFFLFFSFLGVLFDEPVDEAVGPDDDRNHHSGKYGCHKNLHGGRIVREGTDQGDEI